MHCLHVDRLSGKRVDDRGVWQCILPAWFPGLDGRVLCLLQELKLLNEGISKFPYFHKFYLMLGQLEERRGNADAARQAYQAGLKRCMGSAALWRSLSRLEERAGMIGKARNVLEQVRSMPPSLMSANLSVSGTSRFASGHEQCMASNQFSCSFEFGIQLACLEQQQCPAADTELSGSLPLQLLCLLRIQVLWRVAPGH